MKKFLTILLLLAIFSSLCACSSIWEDPDGTLDEQPGYTDPRQNDDEPSGNKDPESQQPSVSKQAEVYSRYSNLVSIGQFCNGLAPFVIQANTWQQNIGYIDIQGNVVIDAIYYVDDMIPVFDMPCVKLYCSAGGGKPILLDRQGGVLFEVGKDNISGIGEPMNGYFWVQSYEEDLSGKTYTVRYYRTSDLKVVATFENMRAWDFYPTGTTSNLNAAGNGILDNPDGGKYKFNIAEFDTTFRATNETWNVDVKELETFEEAYACYYHVSGKNNAVGQLAAVALKNKEGTYYYSIVDSKGNVLLEPQREIAFPVSKYRESGEIGRYDFYMNLCPAQDAASGLWGYIDPYGRWTIQPQYASALSFTDDGYATVNNLVVINTKGETVLAPGSEEITELRGKYRLNNNNSAWPHYITFDGNGTLKYKIDSFTVTGAYLLEGNMLTISGLGDNYGLHELIDETYYISKMGDTLIINGKEWVLVEE